MVIIPAWLGPTLSQFCHIVKAHDGEAYDSLSYWAPVWVELLRMQHGILSHDKLSFRRTKEQAEDIQRFISAVAIAGKRPSDQIVIVSEGVLSKTSGALERACINWLDYYNRLHSGKGRT